MTTVTSEGIFEPKHQPLKTIMTHRRVDLGNKNEGCLGVNATAEKFGTLKLGDLVNVLESGTHNLKGVWNGKAKYGYWMTTALSVLLVGLISGVFISRCQILR